MGMKIKSKQKFLRYTVMYARVPYITKIKFKRKFEIWNTKLSKISLLMVFKKKKQSLDTDRIQLILLQHFMYKINVCVYVSTYYIDTSLRVRMLRSMSHRLGGCSAKLRIEQGSPRSSCLQWRTTESSGHLWRRQCVLCVKHIVRLGVNYTKKVIYYNYF